MNHYIDEWKLISERVREFEKVINLCISLHQVRDTDNHGFFKNYMVPEFKNIIEDIHALKDKYNVFFSKRAQDLLDQFILQKHQNKFFDLGSMSKDFVTSCQAIFPVFTFRASFDHLLKDVEIKIKNITELAFEHLRRTIAVDEVVRGKWDFKEKQEVDFEKMGAIHLLSHGIWAFKIYAEKGRTDLVYQDPLQKHKDSIKRSANGLILTEWKKVEQNTLTKKAKEAIKQMKAYTGGVLMGIELKNTRYVVLISEKDFAPIEDFYEDGICYRHIIVATDPDNPSNHAAKK